MTKATSQGKAFDTSYSSIPVFYPDELVIIGGADLADKRERGPLDTSASDIWDDDGTQRTYADHPLFNKARLEKPLDEKFVRQIDLLGVLQYPLIARLNGHPVINAGRRRTRAARLVNFERKKACGVLGKSDREAAPLCLAKGSGLLKISCAHKAVGDEFDLFARMGAENHGREDDDLATTIEFAKKAVADTNDPQAVAVVLGVDVATVESWLTFDEVATPETKQAVADGRLRITAAAIVAQKKDPTEQNELLAKMMSGDFKPTVRRARQLVRSQTKPSRANPFVGKADLVKFKTFIAEAKPKKGAKETASDKAFREGVSALLELQTTGKTPDKRLAAIYKAFSEG